MKKLRQIVREIETQAQEAAASIGLAVKKSRAMKGPTNANGFMLYDPRTNAVVKGTRYELTLQDVLRYVEENHSRAKAPRRLQRQRTPGERAAAIAAAVTATNAILNMHKKRGT
jgi:hypothetical protein